LVRAAVAAERQRCRAIADATARCHKEAATTLPYGPERVRILFGSIVAQVISMCIGPGPGGLLAVGSDADPGRLDEAQPGDRVPDGEDRGPVAGP